MTDDGPDAPGFDDPHTDSDRSGTDDDHPDSDRTGTDDDCDDANDDCDDANDDAGTDETRVAGEQAVGLEELHDALESRDRPVVSTREVAVAADCDATAATDGLESLEETGHVARMDVHPEDATVWYPRSHRRSGGDERITVFPKRREIVVDQPAQYTRALLTQFARLKFLNDEGGYVYEVREEDVWNVPFETFSELRATMRSALGGRYEALEEWVEGQWERAHKFRLATHDEGYVVLEARSADLLGNVAEQHLPDGVVRARIDDTTAWVADDRTAEIKRTLYEAGYPVQDHRDLDAGDDLAVDLSVDLRPYQADWVARFADAGSGVLVGPPGSGKTIAALGILADVGGETLILVPSRELAGQWREAILEHTTLTADQVGEYHGGTKDVRPVTVATYQTAGMDRHRMLFDSREWGLIVYDECQHVPSPVSRRSAALQTRHRLGLSGSPVREDEKEREIYTLVGPPIGTDWEALFEAGYVAEPEVELRYLPWADERRRNEYGASEGHEKRRLAASNPAKIAEIAAILHEHRGSKALVFVEYIQQGDEIAAALNVPFVSGETPHARRSRLFSEFRSGAVDTLVVSRVGDEGIDLPDAEVAIAASGLGGSRRQGAQRAGRTMRPVGKARMYVLATLGTREEDFARQRTQHLTARGVRVRETDPVAVTDRDRTGEDAPPADRE